MNCKEFAQYITPAVDRRIPEEVLATFYEHANICPTCRREYEGEKYVAALIREQIRPACVPSNVIANILSRLAAENPAFSSPAARQAKHLLHHPVTQTLIAFALSFGAVVLILSRSDSDGPGVNPSTLAGNDVIVQLMSNYQAVLKGEMIPQVTSDRPDRVQNFFEGKTEFPVFVPAMKQCRLIGGVLSDYHGLPCAHVFYKHGQQTIYLYQSCRESVMKGDRLDLSIDVKRDLERTGWHCCTAPDGAAIVLWAKGRTLCAAISAMKGDHLMAHLADADLSGSW